MSGFDPELLKEGDEIAKRFYRKQGSKNFNLEMEAFCKKIWKPWFDAGRWVLLDLTQPETQQFQVEEKLWDQAIKQDVRLYLKSLNFPFDFVITRGSWEYWVGDYKFRPNTKRGVWIEKNDYDKYFSLGVPNFIVLFWSNSEKKRYMLHVKRHPSEYEVKYFETPCKVIEYYDVTKDCEERAPHDTIIKGEIPKGLMKYWVWRLKMDTLISQGSYPEDYKRAGSLVSIKSPKWSTRGLESSRSQTRLRRFKLVKALTTKQIERMEGWEVQVLKPIQPHKRTMKVSFLGFDTEFHEDRLLSVQLALMDSEGTLKSKCISENLKGYDAKRLLKDSLDFMLECGIEPFNRIYLIAHFAVADVGHLKNCLKDFRLREINRAMNADFVIPESEQELQFKELKLGDFRLKIVDLWAYYPYALKKIGDMIGLPKLEVDREHILDVYDNEPKKFREYAVRDAEIALKAFVGLRDFLWNKYKVEIVKSPTIASVASHIFRINHLLEIPVRSKVEVRYQPYRTTKGEWSTRGVKETRYAGSLDLRSLALRCYWGGRAESFVHGFIEGKFKLYDVVSLFPSCAMLQPLPNKDTLWVEISKDNFRDKGLEGYVSVVFDFPEGTQYPNLPVHGELKDRLYFPLKGESYCTMSEVREALRLGCKIKRIHGFGFIPSEKEINHDLKAFMKEMLELKSQSPEGSIERETYKLVANALIGKLAQRRAENHLDYAQELYVTHGVPIDKFRFKGREKVGSTWAPEWASLILGKARALMSQFINKGALMTVTDSVLLPSDANIECEALNELRAVGSDLHADPREVESALIVRTRLYALRDANGEIFKEAHHAVHLSSEKCKEIFAKALELGCDPDIEGNKDHIIRLREALMKGKPLGSSELKPSRIYFRWDEKRVLTQPLINMFREYSETQPIKDVVKFESDFFKVMKHQRAKAKRGRPRAYPDEIVDQVASLRKEGKSYRQIAKALNISLGKVQRILSRLEFKSKR